MASEASKSREVILHLCSPLVRHIWSAGSRSGLPCTKDTWTCWSWSSKGPQRWWSDWSIRNVRTGRASWDFWAWTREGSRGSLISVCKYVMGGGKKRSIQTLPSGFQCQDKTQWKHIEIQVIPFQQKKKENTVRVIKHWNKLPKQVVESSSVILSDLLYLTLLEQGCWTRKTPGIPSNLRGSVILLPLTVSLHQSC